MNSLYLLRTLRAGLVGFGALAVVAGPVGPATADETEATENFSYTSWDLDYQISLDSAGRAQAEVTEELVAQFPDYDQNRGIIRSLPDRYHGAPAAPQDISVTDEDGSSVPFEVEDDGGFRSILVGDDSFVRGEQTYVISYTVDDVMHATEEADEFYWDLVPADREQDISAAAAEISVDAELSSALTGSASCYQGAPGSTDSCAIESAGDDAFTVGPVSLPGGEALTAAFGVEPGTVAQPEERSDSFALDILPLLLAGASALIGLGGCLAVLSMVRRHRQPEHRAPVQFAIPSGLTPLIAGPVAGAAQNALVPAILDMAVHGVIRIIEAESSSGWFSKKPKPAVELLDPQLASDPLEAQLLEGMFPTLEPGEVFTFPNNDKTFSKTSQKVLRASAQATLDRGHFRRVRHREAAWSGAAALVLLIPVPVLMVIGASRDNAVVTGISVVLGLMSLMLAIICLAKHRVHTPQGAQLRARLLQVQQMLKASEADRLAMMQSYWHAAGSRVSPSGKEADSTIEVYDRLLPYAVLFGRQKEWAAVLASTYEHHHVPAPLWFPALLSSGPQGMQSSLHSMLSSVSSAAGTSSSGAGSTGAGAAGGGGGGGAAGGR